VPRKSYPFVDWLKALGMSLIVYGHVAHATTVPLTPPIYLKQFGVAFFLFATGFTLAREPRGAAETVFNRLFQTYLFGVALAVLLTVMSLSSGGRGMPSNYLPFAIGLNVVFDNFPANPTTWYLGTYIHLLLIWAVCLRHVRIRPWMVLVAIALEIPIRAWLIPAAGPYGAYMLLTNWIAVFLLGLARGAEPDPEARRSGVPYGAALAGGLVVWGLAMTRLGFEPTFPFMTLAGWPVAAGLMFVSASVSLLYVGTTALVFETTRFAPAPAPVRFVARHSLIIFLAHMPLYYLLQPVLAAWTTSYWTRVIILLLVCLPGLGMVSAGIIAVVRPERLRAQMFAWIPINDRFALRGGVPVVSDVTQR
jgi:peptidoglycan/LPS O-acetylase OafA/YrhL